MVWCHVMELWLWCSRFLMCGWNSWCENACRTCIVRFPWVASMPFGYNESNSVCLRLPSPVLEVPKSKSSLVTFWESRYVAGTQPCSSAVLTNHQPAERETEQNSVDILQVRLITAPVRNKTAARTLIFEPAVVIRHQWSLSCKLSTIVEFQ